MYSDSDSDSSLREFEESLLAQFGPLSEAKTPENEPLSFLSEENKFFSPLPNTAAGGEDYQQTLTPEAITQDANWHLWSAAARVREAREILRRVPVSFVTKEFMYQSFYRLLEEVLGYLSDATDEGYLAALFGLVPGSDADSFQGRTLDELRRITRRFSPLDENLRAEPKGLQAARQVVRANARAQSDGMRPDIPPQACAGASLPSPPSTHGRGRQGMDHGQSGPAAQRPESDLVLSIPPHKGASGRQPTMGTSKGTPHHAPLLAVGVDAKRAPTLGARGSESVHPRSGPAAAMQPESSRVDTDSMRPPGGGRQPELPMVSLCQAGGGTNSSSTNGATQSRTQARRAQRKAQDMRKGTALPLS